MNVAFDMINAGSNPPFAKLALLSFPIANQTGKAFIFNTNEEFEKLK